MVGDELQDIVSLMDNTTENQHSNIKYRNTVQKQPEKALIDKVYTPD